MRPTLQFLLYTSEEIFIPLKTPNMLENFSDEKNIVIRGFSTTDCDLCLTAPRIKVILGTDSEKCSRL